MFTIQLSDVKKPLLFLLGEPQKFKKTVNYLKPGLIVFDGRLRLIDFLYMMLLNSFYIFIIVVDAVSMKSYTF